MVSLVKLSSSTIILPLWKLILSCVSLQFLTIFIYFHYLCKESYDLSIKPNSQYKSNDALLSAQSSSSIEIEPYPVRGPFSWNCINEALKNEYTMNNQIPIKLKELQGNDLLVHGDIKTTNYFTEFSNKWTTDSIQDFVKKVKEKNSEFPASAYGFSADSDLHEAFEKYSIKGVSVLVVGSQSPWVEAFCIFYGARFITTVDFNVPVVEDPNLIRAIGIADLAKSRETFDVVISFSSLEHDGLGRYGDPLNPHGDIERMKRLKLLVRPGGKMFLSVPSGPDFLYWNAHRIYGPLRLPKLIQGWKVLDVFGWDSVSGVGELSQPVRVLTPE